MSAVTFTTDQVIKGISNCSNTKAFGPDKLSIFHLKNLGPRAIEYLTAMLLLLFAMIRSVVKSFKVPDVEVAAARMSNESALTRMTDSTPKKTWSDLTLVLDG